MSDSKIDTFELDKADCFNEYSVDKETRAEKIVRLSKKSVGTGTSYLLSGLGHTGDIIIYTVGGVGVGLLICSPVILLEGSLAGQGDASGECIGNVSSSIYESFRGEFSIGDGVYQKTSKWRCPEVDHISQGLRRVANCYRKNKDFSSSDMQLNAILDDPLLGKCISNAEKAKVSQLISI